MEINLLYIKALHIIFMVAWFAGLFYIPRLFIYQTEANEGPEPAKSILVAQLQLMAKRLWFIITWPAALLTFLFGFWLMFAFGYWALPWMHLKLGFVGLLALYHVSLHRIFNQLQSNTYRYSSTQLRIYNEVATLLLFAIVFVVVLKDMFSWLWGLGGLLLLGLVLMLAVKLYKKARLKK